MAKDINIHIKTQGAEQAKQQLNSVGHGAEKVGGSVEQMGAGAKRGSNTAIDALKKLAGPIGFLALGTAIVSAAGKMVRFFDDLKKKTDEASEDVLKLRTSFDSLFEAMGAFDEKSRQAVTSGALKMLEETGVSEGVGLPIIDAYTRQFKSLVDSGQLTGEQYQTGLKGMLGYGARHGGAATGDLISMMKGWGMITPEQQGAFRRQIASGAAGSGLTDEELINALSRGIPTIKAMGWTPEQAVETIATLAMGETGRKKASLPATTIQALGAPQIGDAAQYGISEDVANDPQRLFGQVQRMGRVMDQKSFYSMLNKLYGTEGAAGVYKLATADRSGIRRDISQAAGPAGIGAEIEEEMARRGTREAVSSSTEAWQKRMLLESVTSPEFYEGVIRDIGGTQQEIWERKRPVQEYLRQLFILGNEAEKEDAAFTAWFEGLSDEEKMDLGGRAIPVPDLKTGKIRKVYEPESLKPKWKAMSAKERYSALRAMSLGEKETYNALVGKGVAPGETVNIIYNNNIIHYPITDAEDRHTGGRYIHSDGY